VTTAEVSEIRFAVLQVEKTGIRTLYTYLGGKRFYFMFITVFQSRGKIGVEGEQVTVRTE